MTKTPRSESAFRAARTDLPSGEKANGPSVFDHGALRTNTLVEPCRTTSPVAPSSRHTVIPDLVSVASVLLSGEKASGPKAPDKNRTSCQVEVSHTRTPPSRVIVARRVASLDSAIGAKFLFKDLRSDQSAVFQSRAVLGLAVTRVLPSGKKASEKPPCGSVAKNVFVCRF